MTSLFDAVDDSELKKRDKKQDAALVPSVAKTYPFPSLPFLVPRAWVVPLYEPINAHYFADLDLFLQHEYLERGFYPHPTQIFAALEDCSPDSTRVVMLGLDPFIGQGQATGRSFSVQFGTEIPPSSKNILQEIKDDLKIEPINSGDFGRWHRQGVLGLNSILTVRPGVSRSHADKGWEYVTDHIISYLSVKREALVFMLWGSDAQSKARLIDREKHLVLESSHPSPKSAAEGRRPFLGSKPFSRCNTFLAAHGFNPIDWR